MAEEKKVKKIKKETKAVEKKVVEKEVGKKVEKETKKESKSKLITGTGRRKTAVARVFMYEKKGGFTVNDKDIKDYYDKEIDNLIWEKPFHVVGVAHPEAKFSATIKVHGSGNSAQVQAIQLGISRALAKMDPEWEILLKKQKLLTRDPRMVERKKPNLHKARKATQYSKR
jgi:small subunit ribosomal protein S9